LGRKQGQQKLFCVNSSTQEFKIPKSDERAFECAASTNGEKTGVWPDRHTLKEGVNTFVFGDLERVEEYRKQEEFRRNVDQQILRRMGAWGFKVQWQVKKANRQCWLESICWSMLLAALLVALSGSTWKQRQMVKLHLAPLGNKAGLLEAHAQAAPGNENNIPSLPTSRDATALAEDSLQEIAKLVTVRIFTHLGAGSGVIISRQGQTYTVLTNAHVVEDSQDDRYTVLTADGRSHSAQLLRSPQFGDLDLAIVQFTSDQSYKIVQLGNLETIAVGDSVYAAGFPNWRLNDSNAIESTRSWGLRAFHFTTGQVEMLSALPLLGGYQLGYTNEIESGMSGGPVLDRNGLLIGINGRLKYPLQGIRVFAFTDGTLPSEELFHQMEALSWAIPISTFQKLSEAGISHPTFELKREEL